MIPLVATIIPLGLAAAIKPALLALQLMVVSSNEWWPRARALALGAAIPMISFGVLFALGFSQLPTDEVGQISIVGISLRTIIGVGFVLASMWLLRPHKALQQKISTYVQTKMNAARVRDFFVLGLVMNGKSITAYALLLPALHDIAIAPVSGFVQVLALILLLVLVLATVWIPIAVRIVFGQRINFAAFSNFLLAHDFRILGITAIVIGLYLTGTATALLIASP